MESTGFLPSRRGFLIGLGVGVAGVTSVGAALLGSTPRATSGIFGDEWLFGEYVAGGTDADFDDSGLLPVTVPHCVTPLSWQKWDPATWQTLWLYRQHFDAPAGYRHNRTFLRFDGILSAATVYVNGRQAGTKACGYLPLTCELTGLLSATGNVVAVVVDGRWRQDIPPDAPTFAQPTAIDFYQPAGMYRTAVAITTPKTYLSDVFAQPMDVLTPDRAMTLSCTVNASARVTGPVQLNATLSQNGTLLASASVEVAGLSKGDTAISLGMADLAAVRLWDVDDPALCDVTVTLVVNGQEIDRYALRTGFRDARFTADGFFLNGRRRTLFGVNRHQWYPFVGGAMPDRVQRKDAEILKRELNCTMVRCSHYPQSPAFLDACDELGIMVWEEIPGWDYVGDATWQDRALQNVNDMVVRDRNHPSIIVWGTRINETLGQLHLYERTDLLALKLDPSRPCTGAVAGQRGYDESPYPMAEGGSSVFSFNDYSPLPAPDATPRLRPPRDGVPYLVSEAIGSLVGHAHYRRVDPMPIQSDQATLHAWVHERAAADSRYCGLLAWCGFDYPSGWFHSVAGVKYPGVVDFFRIPKLGAAFYQAQVEPSVRPVIEPAFYWDFGPNSPRRGPGRALIWSNCDRLAVYIGRRRITLARPERELFPHLPYPPFAVDLTVARPEHRPELRIDGFVGNRLVSHRSFSSDPVWDTLSCAADDTTLNADGQDATRVVVRALDRYGAQRPYATGDVSFDIAGPGVLVGDNPFDFGAAGGAGAVWIRTIKGVTGQVTLVANHATLGLAEATVQVV